MLNKNMSKSEIENAVGKCGDFVQIDHLTRFLKNNPPLEIKKFVYMKLAGIYEKRAMFGEAGFMFDQIALNSVTSAEKMKSHTREAEMYIRGGIFEKVDNAVKRALKEANAGERAEIYLKIKNFYKEQAELYETTMRKGNAVRVYQKLLEMNLGDSEKIEIKEKLLDLYKKLGKFEDIRKLERGDQKNK